MTGCLELAPPGTEGGEIQLRHGTDAENGVILDTTGNNFRIFGSPNVGSVFVYNPQTAQLIVGSQHIVRSVNGVGAGTNGNVTLSIPSAYTHPSTHPASMITGLATVATSGKYSDLSGRPSIPATPKAYIVETWRSGSNWYRKWSDGFMEQGGLLEHSGASTVTCTFNKAFSTICLSAWCITESSVPGAEGNDYVSSITKSSCKFRKEIGRLYWRALGY